MHATVEQLENHLGEDRYLALVDRDNDGAADTDAVEAALADASSLCDSYVSRWLPLSEPPKALVTAVLDLAVYQLAGNRSTEDERRRYEDALRWLRDVSVGRATLGTGPQGQASRVCVEPARHQLGQTSRIL